VIQLASIYLMYVGVLAPVKELIVIASTYLMLVYLAPVLHIGVLAPIYLIHNVGVLAPVPDTGVLAPIYLIMVCISCT
jgi:hypothetical protein